VVAAILTRPGVALGGLWDGLVRRLPLGTFGRNVALLSAGTALGQGIVVLASPVLTRLYAPEDFGVLAVYMALVSVVSTVASLRYELAIPLPERDADARSLLQLALVLVLAVSVVLAGVVGFWGGALAAWLKVPALEPYIWLVPAGVALVGAYQALTYWAVRQGAFGAVARTKLSQGLGNVLTQVLLGLLGSKAAGLLVGDVAGRSAGIATLARRAGFVGKVEGHRLAAVAVRYRKFPLLSAGSSLINAAGLQLPQLLLAGFYGPQVAGWYLLVQRVMGSPTSLVGQATAQVYLREAARLRREAPERLRALYFATGRKLLLLGAVPIGAVGLVAPWVFAPIFGRAWETAGRYMQVLVPLFVLQFVVYPLSQTLNVLERQELQFLWDLLRLVIVGLVLWLPYVKGWGAMGAMVGLGVGGAAAYVALGGFGVHALFLRERDMRSSAG